MADPNAWGEASVERLTQLWNEEGYSAAQCARALNVELGTNFSRNAVIGKATRIGLAKRGPSMNERRTMPRLQAPRLPSVPRVVRAVVEEPMEAIGGLTTLSAGAQVNACRWPMGDMIPGEGYSLCGRQQMIKSPYCEGHARVAYTKPKPRDGGQRDKTGRSRY